MNSVNANLEIERAQWEFLEREFLTNSIMGAFQRANVYSHQDIVDNQIRDEVRKSFKFLIKEKASTYHQPVTPEQHIVNIQDIATKLTEQFKEANILQENRFRIGIVQKALNLYLMYLWCLGKIPTPPHYPFDSIVIAKLPLEEREKHALQWTKLDCITKYQTLVNSATKAMEEPRFKNISEWELIMWNRKINFSKENHD